MLTKASFVLLFVVGLAAAASVSTGFDEAELQSRAKNASNHLTAGSRQAGDYLLSQQVVFKSSTIFLVVTKDVSFTTPNKQKITYIRATDQKTNGNGAYPSITKGGVGSNNVTVHFKSQRGHSISFLLEIYGR